LRDSILEKSQDKVRKSDGNLTNSLKNVYRVLLTRGMKGCYVYFMDKNTRDFIKSRIENFN